VRTAKKIDLREIIIETNFNDPVAFFGANDKNLKILQSAFPLSKIILRGNGIRISGEDQEVTEIEQKIRILLNYTEKVGHLPENIVMNVISGKKNGENGIPESGDIILYGSQNQPIRARTPNQAKLLQEVEKKDIVFAIGPAGTGKTYTSVAIAVKALKNKEVKRIILTRPAVEAGENLGFLPGDMREKVDPYLRPLYDALYDMMPGDKLAAYLERNVIEIAPLAFMRGRTLDNAYVILDEAQNCTRLQLKMFLTRMGPNARFIITGDLTQIDLPVSQSSGLINALSILSHISGIGVVEFDVEDVVRHKLVKEIVIAYSKKQ
jgi:phosphate starvation-inducible protein PhoH and related proteins